MEDSLPYRGAWTDLMADTEGRLRSMTTDALLWEVKCANDQIDHLGPMPIQLVVLYRREIEARLGPSLWLLHPGVFGL